MCNLLLTWCCGCIPIVVTINDPRIHHGDVACIVHGHRTFVRPELRQLESPDGSWAMSRQQILDRLHVTSNFSIEPWEEPKTRTIRGSALTPSSHSTYRSSTSLSGLVPTDLSCKSPFGEAVPLDKPITPRPIPPGSRVSESSAYEHGPPALTRFGNAFRVPGNKVSKMGRGTNGIFPRLNGSAELT